MYLCSCPREHLLNLFPKDGVAAEIGTAEGVFARAILDNAKPRVLHLIDPWAHFTDGAYTADLSNVSAERQDARHRDVLVKFAAEIAGGRVVVHRATSAAAAAEFPDGELDWVYVDGLHSEDGVHADLAAYAAKLKGQGFIAGHDYTNNPLAERQGFGVIEAVNRFVAETDFRLILMTLEAFPTYLLARPGPVLDRLIGGLFLGGAVVAEIEGYPAAGRFFHRYYQVGERRGLLPVFGLSGGDADKPGNDRG
jgi:hypothetical protein